jgi:hypothetical protein
MFVVAAFLFKDRVMKYLIILLALPVLVVADTLSWIPVTERENGDAITEQVSYVVYRNGTQHTTTTESSLDVSGACSLTDWTVTSLVGDLASEFSDAVAQPVGVTCRPKSPTGLTF